MVEALNAAGIAALGSTDLMGRHREATTACSNAVRRHRGRSAPTEAADHLVSMCPLFSGPDGATLEHRCDYSTNRLHLRNL
jgi:hypothetical protein